MPELRFRERSLDISLAPTPWNDRVLGGPSGHLTVEGMHEYATTTDLRHRDDWLARRLADEGLVYVSTSADAADTAAKAVVQHLGFDFIYQTTTCILRLDQTVSLRDSHPAMEVVDPVSVASDEVAELCATTLKHGRFCEDWLTRELAGPRNAAFVRDLHARENVHRVFTRAPSDRLNGYAYIPIERGSADLLLMGISEADAPPGAGQSFWEICLADLRSRGLARRVWTRVPAANLGVLNIYARIGFNFVGPAYDFRMLPQAVSR